MENITKKRKLTDETSTSIVNNNMNFSQDEEFIEDSQNNNTPSPFSYNLLSPVSSKEAKSPPSDTRIIKEIGNIMKTKHNLLERLSKLIVSPQYIFCSLLLICHKGKLKLQMKGCQSLLLLQLRMKGPTLSLR